jgi:serine phosphatase RsbU (regulator of sigma subunit)
MEKEIVEEKHQEITDSINYAERLQRSLMASKNILDKNLTEYFIYFNPKEAVSGDFYWASELKNGKFLLACADSTGHGVPGAIMSMMNMNSLKESVKEGFVSPNEILNETRKIVIETLANDGSEDGGKDGMDCSLLSFDFKNDKLEFALANNPLWIIRNEGRIEYKADKMPIGRHDMQHIPFTKHEIDLQKGDLIYIFTDGFADQFGGPKGKKFKYATFNNLLLENSNNSIIGQRSILSDTFLQWKGNFEQTDDVCVIGIRI